MGTPKTTPLIFGKPPYLPRNSSLNPKPYSMHENVLHHQPPASEANIAAADLRYEDFSEEANLGVSQIRGTFLGPQ